MKTNFLIGLFVVSMTLFLETIVYGQQNGNQTCDYHSYISERDAYHYIGNYVDKFNKSTTRQNSHTRCVDFSKEAFHYFVDKVFCGNCNVEYTGASLHFAYYKNDKTAIPGEKIGTAQVGIFLSPTKGNPLIDSLINDFDLVNIRNNSFNQDPDDPFEPGYTNTNSIIPLTSADAKQTKIFYAKRFTAPFRINKKHSRSMFLEKCIFLELDNFLRDHPNYNGIRVYFGSYNEKNISFGQTRKRQITLLLVPIMTDGKGDFTLFTGSKKKNRKLLDVKGKLLDAANHGDLCPTICPH